MTARDDPPWLTNDEMRLWRSIVALGSTMQQIEGDLKRDSDLSSPDYEVLVNLSESPDHQLRMSELSERVANSRSRLSQRIDRLTERGLVSRQQCPVDKRSTFAVLTDLGMNTIQAAAPDHVRSVRNHLIDRLDPNDVKTAADILGSLQGKTT